MAKLDLGPAVRRRHRHELLERCHDALVERQQSSIDRNAHPGRRDALGDRGDIVRLVSKIGVEIRVQDENTVPHHLQAIDGQVLLVDLLYDLREHIGVEPLLFGGCRGPTFPGRGRLGFAAAATPGEDHADAGDDWKTRYLGHRNGTIGPPCEKIYAARRP
jgi:hypothetical protein